MLRLQRMLCRWNSAGWWLQRLLLRDDNTLGRNLGKRLWQRTLPAFMATEATTSLDARFFAHEQLVSSVNMIMTLRSEARVNGLGWKADGEQLVAWQMCKKSKMKDLGRYPTG